MKKRRKKRDILFFVILAALIFAVILISRRLEPQVKSLISAKAHERSLRIINEEILKISSSGECENLARESDIGKAKIISLDTESAARIKSSLVLDISKRLDELPSREISIPLGNASGNIFLHGRGPYVPVKVMNVDFVEAEIKSEFLSGGINQTLHRLVIEVCASFTLAMPGESFSVESNVSIPISERIIIGEVPEFYADRGE